MEVLPKKRTGGPDWNVRVKGALLYGRFPSTVACRLVLFDGQLLHCM